MIKTPRGTKDILPSEIKNWQWLESKIRQTVRAFNYEELRTPIFESTEVFSRSIGDATDIVNKEMYTFEDRGGNSITLRPEMTASLVRSAIEHNLATQGLARLWYFGPFFRYERPQKGRFRQFHQFGAECLGADSPEADVEIITLCEHLNSNVGIKERKLILNSLGNKESRANYISALVDFYNDNKNSLSETSLERLDKNPLRILDSKSPDDIEINKNAPIILDHLDNESSDHFEKVKELLDANEINYEIQARLVRGLDYYSHSVFEFQSTALGAQDSFGGGGRYNELFSQLGGKDVPAVGFAMGVERLLLIIESLNKLPDSNDKIDVYVLNASKNAPTLIQKILKKLRSKNLTALNDLSSRSMKAQFKEANRLNAKWTIVIGDDELSSGKLTIKNMETSEQSHITFDDLMSFEF